MQKVFLVMILSLLAGCASEAPQRCEKINGVVVCQGEKREPREPREPRAGRE